MSITEVQNEAVEDLRGAIGNAPKSILLLESEPTPTDSLCTALLPKTSSTNSHFLGITLDNSPDEALHAWRTGLEQMPPRVGIIAVDEMTRSATATQAPAGHGTGPATVNSISSPSDLTGLAIAIGAYLDSWEGEAVTPMVCFRSISSLLFHSDVHRVFKFLHLTAGRLKERGATTHFHYDPRPFDDSTTSAFMGLFDPVVESNPDGTIQVKKRR